MSWLDSDYYTLHYTIIIVAKRGLNLGNRPIYVLITIFFATWCNCSGLAWCQLYLPDLKIDTCCTFACLFWRLGLNLLLLNHFLLQVLTQVLQLKPTKMKPFVFSGFHYCAYYLPLNHCTVGLESLES